MKQTRFNKFLINLQLILAVILVLGFIITELYAEAFLLVILLTLVNMDNHIAGIYNRLNGK